MVGYARLIPIIITILLSLVLLSGLSPLFCESKDHYAYVVSYQKNLFRIKAYLSTFDLRTLKEVKKKPINLWIARVWIRPDGKCLLLSTQTIVRNPNLKKVYLYDPKLNKTKELFETPSLSPVRGFWLKSKLYIIFEGVFKTKEAIQKEPHLTPYQYGGLEVYDFQGYPTLNAIIQLGRNDFIYGTDISPDGDTMYLGVAPLLFENPLDPSKPLFNREGISYIYSLDLKTNKIVQKKNISQHLKGISALKIDGKKVYVTGLYTPNQTNSYQDADSLEHLNREMYVFDLKTLTLIKQFGLEGMTREIYSVPEDKRLFVFHRGGIGDDQSVISVIDTEKDEPIAFFKMNGIENIAYVGHHKLFVVTKDKLLIMDTQTLKWVKEINGLYGEIARKI